MSATNGDATADPTTVTGARPVVLLRYRPGVIGERYGVALPWPAGVHRVTATLPLPPTMTTRGPITWVHPPKLDALRLCREIDVLAALRTVLRTPPA